MRVKVVQLCQTLCDPMDYIVHTILQARTLERVVFPFSRGSSIPGTEPRSPALQVVLYQLSHQGSPRILEWVAYPFSSRSSQPRNRTGVSRFVGRFFTNWAIREALIYYGPGIFLSPSVLITMLWVGTLIIPFFRREILGPKQWSHWPRVTHSWYSWI